MRVGFIGAGNMARALARGWGEPVLCTDSGSGRARALTVHVRDNRRLAPAARERAGHVPCADEADLHEAGYRSPTTG